jgi:cation:H+ antiporter
VDAVTAGLLLVVGLAATVAGAELLVRGASRLAAAFGVPPLVVGLTVVAFGTSAPELAVSVEAALTGAANIAVGNVVGSNIFNVLFILGVSALVAPLSVALQIVRQETWIMLAASLIGWALIATEGVGRGEGALLVAGIIAYTWKTVRDGRREQRGETTTAIETAPSWLKSSALVAAGLGLLVFGADQLVDGTLALGRLLGVSELILGLTVVAAGTSLPEAATSIVASYRGERDIAVGNVVGSNIFNILAVLGVAALVSPIPIVPDPSALAFDIPVMTAVAVACLPIFFTGHSIERWEGVLFLAYYVAYVTYLILDETNSAALKGFSAAMLGFVIPLTVVTLIVVTWRSYRAARRAA